MSGSVPLSFPAGAVSSSRPSAARQIYEPGHQHRLRGPDRLRELQAPCGEGFYIVGIGNDMRDSRVFRCDER